MTATTYREREHQVLKSFALQTLADRSSTPEDRAAARARLLERLPPAPSDVGLRVLQRLPDEVLDQLIAAHEAVAREANGDAPAADVAG